MKKLSIFILTGIIVLLGYACKNNLNSNTPESKNMKENGTNYFSNTGRNDVISGGVKMIEINTPKGKLKVWTKRVGNNPKIKVLLLHGGPGSSHRIYTCFDSYFPKAGFEYYYYDQLGSFFSDNPADSTLWTLERFVDEVEQVRIALGLNKDNFYLFGSSWGGLLATEYALKYQENIKGLIICSVMSSMPDYKKYANEVLAQKLNPKELDEIRKLESEEDFENPRYSELLQNFYSEFVIRLPPEEVPEPVTWTMSHLNRDIYELMQGPSEFGIQGRLANWDRNKQLKNIKIPTLVIGSKYNTMDPKHCEWMAGQIPQGQYLYCSNGSHLMMYDDQEVFFEGLINFINNVNSD